jgi:hypothetical protein
MNQKISIKSPMLPPHDAVYLRCAKIELPTKDCLHSILPITFLIYPAYFINVCCRNLAGASRFAMNLTAFSNLVIMVKCVITNPKVFWIGARWVVAAGAVVKNIHSKWDGSVMNYPTYSVRPKCKANRRANSYLTVAVSLLTSRPQPASVRTGSSVNVLPERINNLLWKGLLCKHSGCNLHWHFNSLIVDLLAPFRRQPDGAPSIYNNWSTLQTQ